MLFKKKSIEAFVLTKQSVITSKTNKGKNRSNVGLTNHSSIPFNKVLNG